MAVRHLQGVDRRGVDMTNIPDRPDTVFQRDASIVGDD